MTESLQDIPEIGVFFEPSSMTGHALAYAKQHCDAKTYYHTIRSVYWAMIIANKDPSVDVKSVDLEAVIVSCILHDMGWAETKALLSTDKRFEVDGANIAKEFLKKQQHAEDTGVWDQHRIQRCWDSIALHTTPSIAKYAAPEVALTALGILADFMGPAFPNGPSAEDNLISIDEYHAVMKVAPRSGFTPDGFKDIMCGLCRDKPATTYDNFVGLFGVEFGLDGHGDGKEEFAKIYDENQIASPLLDGLAALTNLDRTAP